MAPFQIEIAICQSSTYKNFRVSSIIYRLVVKQSPIIIVRFYILYYKKISITRLPDCA